LEPFAKLGSESTMKNLAKLRKLKEPKLQENGGVDPGGKIR
jgi:hypothetical protein